jgi:lipopolysaccharide biosynthesis protein
MRQAVPDDTVSAAAPHGAQDPERTSDRNHSVTDQLRADNEALQQRIDDLEQVVAEYRLQMQKVLTSSSWRMTSPIRMTAGKVRWHRTKAKQRIRRVLKREQAPAFVVPTAGLFMPELDRLPETSPLRRRIDVNALRRPKEADGPLQRPEGDPQVLVVAHVHYPELWGDIAERLIRMPEPYDLIVTVTQGHGERAIGDIRASHPDARIEAVPNQGRDWAPLVSLANRGLLSGYKAVGKIHTKKSEHRVDGDAWRLELLDGIFPSPEAIQRTIDLLDEDRDVGMVVPAGHVSGPEHWGSDQGIVEALAYRMSMAFHPDRLQFPAGSMFWCRPWLLERLADLDIDDSHFELEAGQYDGTTAHGLERLIGVFTTVAGMDIVEHPDVAYRLNEYRKAPRTKPSIYCFYLPQYHQCPENDEFWGEGFTDWDNVKKAKPLFEGHRQPILPSDDVGFYDLKNPDVLRKQWAMASQFGIDGFVFHYYWFDGRKVLDTPLNNWLADPTIELPLALCWANEPWTRRWDGLERDVLISQTYSEDWANRFWDDIAPVLADPRYIRWDDAPILVIYRLGQIPHAARAIDTWRKLAADDGHPRLHVVGVAVPREEQPWPKSLRGALDDVVTFPPGSGVSLHALTGTARGALIPGRPRAVLSYDAMYAEVDWSDGAVPCITPGWDNAARRGGGAFIFHGVNPVTWSCHVRAAAVTPSRRVFINAWNEWSEGAALEGSRQCGARAQESLVDVFALTQGNASDRNGGPSMSLRHRVETSDDHE